MNYSEDQTQDIAKGLLQQLVINPDGATILALQGDLGAGKTTLTKALAKELGIEETVVSPTFVIAKFYELFDDAQGKTPFIRLVHIDAYRIESNEELQPLGWEEIIQQPKTLVIVEWPERVAGMLPSHTQYFSITHNDDKRIITKV